MNKNTNQDTTCYDLAAEQAASNAYRAQRVARLRASEQAQADYDAEMRAAPPAVRRIAALREAIRQLLLPNGPKPAVVERRLRRALAEIAAKELSLAKKPTSGRAAAPLTDAYRRRWRSRQAAAKRVHSAAPRTPVKKGKPQN